MADGWKDFVHTVKHEYRYFFSRKIPEEYSEELSPLAVLEAVGRIANGLELINILPSGTELFRVRNRAHNATWDLNARQLGPPPNEQANAGRMNPAGISYFYLAKDQQTALAEVVAKPPCKVISASFKTCRDLLILDLCNHPAIPSIFDENSHDQREWIYFLHHFIREISQPVAKNGHEHIDYVASQIVSEYLAKEFRTTDEQLINGVTYPSTVRPGGVNIVLFPPQEEGNDKLFKLTETGYEGFFELTQFESAREVEFKNWSEFLAAII
jgi:RES domain-containing protein